MNLNLANTLSKLSSFIFKETSETENSMLNGNDVIKDYGKFLNRVYSFSPVDWYGRPLYLSPVQCASRGWTNIGEGILQCQSCNNKIGGLLDPNLDIHAARLTYQRLKDLLINGHNTWCVWKSCSVPDRFLMIDINEEVQHNFIDRFKSLLLLTSIPIISEEFILNIEEESCRKRLKDYIDTDYSFQEILSFISLALCGWNVSEANKNVLKCKFCKRSLGLWNYKIISKDSNIIATESSKNTESSLGTNIPQIFSKDSSNVQQNEDLVRNIDELSKEAHYEVGDIFAHKCPTESNARGEQLLKDDIDTNSLSEAKNRVPEIVVDNLEDTSPLVKAVNKLKRHLDSMHQELQLEYKKQRIEIDIDKKPIHPISEHELWCVWVGSVNQESVRCSIYDSNNLDIPCFQLLKLIFYQVNLSLLDNENRIIEVHRVKNLLQL